MEREYYLTREIWVKMDPSSLGVQILEIVTVFFFWRTTQLT